MNEKEQKRLVVLNLVMAGQTTAEGAAGMLELSERQVRRLLAAYREEGAAALAHGNRGRRPANVLAEGVRDRVVELATTKYQGFNHEHLTEWLNEAEEVAIARSSVRRILLDAGVKSPRKRRAPKHRSRRERYAQEGMLLQIDGSRHDWLEGRGPYLTLVGAIDDATGTVPFALFREQEDAHGYFLLFDRIVSTKGRPLAVYRDRHGIFEPLSKQPWTLEEELAGRREPTQFGRMLEELEIASIPARSPQAKGRIERMWGTFQDRLTSEMRLAGASCLEDANRSLWEFLPSYNRRFAVPAAHPGLAYRPLPAGLDPGTVFCFKYCRTVAPDNTVRLGEHCLQLLPTRERSSYSRAQVEVQEQLDGSLAVYHEGRPIAAKPAPMEAPVLRARKGRRKHTTELGRGLEPHKEDGSGSDPAIRSNLPEAPTAPKSAASRPRPAPDHPWHRPLKRPTHLNPGHPPT